MNKHFIFDYDDTLAWNLHDYSYPKIELQKFIIDKLGHHAPECSIILKIEEEIDANNVKNYGFSKIRFPTSFKNTYMKIRKDAGLDKDPKGEVDAFNIGLKAFNVSKYHFKGLVKGAKETLDYLTSQKDELILLTKGDKDIQWSKIESTEVKKWFGEKIHIVDMKNPGIIHHIVENRDKSKVYHVGNSVRSDAEPALEAGINMILIPYETWLFEKKHNGIPKHPNLRVFDNIIDIIENYNTL